MNGGRRIDFTLASHWVSGDDGRVCRRDSHGNDQDQEKDASQFPRTTNQEATHQTKWKNVPQQFLQMAKQESTYHREERPRIKAALAAVEVHHSLVAKKRGTTEAPPSLTWWANADSLWLDQKTHKTKDRYGSGASSIGPSHKKWRLHNKLQPGKNEFSCSRN